MNRRNATHNNIDNRFRPWAEWHPEEDLCFHDRIAQGIKNKALTVDKMAAVALQLLNSANEIAQALLKEVRYVDSTCVGHINTCALVAAQHHISKACKLFYGRGSPGCTVKHVEGTKMLEMHEVITTECYSALRMLDTFYHKLGAWLYECDAKYKHAVQISSLLVNVIDTVQQCRSSVHPHEYAARNEDELEDILERSKIALAVVTNALNAVYIPGEDEREIMAQKAAISTNAALLVSTTKLLGMAARRAFSLGTQKNKRALENLRSIKRSCNLRSAILRTQVEAFRTTAEKDQSGDQQIQILMCSTVVWGLLLLSDDIDAIACGEYACGECALHYATKISLNTTQCITALTLLCVAYCEAGRETSELAKMLDNNRKMACEATLCLSHLEERNAQRMSETSVKMLHEVLTSLEYVRADLMSIDKRRLLHARWASSLLDDAVHSIDKALDICAIRLSIAEAQKRSHVLRRVISKKEGTFSALVSAICREGLGNDRPQSDTYIPERGIVVNTSIELVGGGRSCVYYRRVS